MSDCHRVIDKIPSRIAVLRKLDFCRCIFGANGHHYHLLPPLSTKLVEDLEASFEVELPEDYRYFVTNVGNGGAGPGYGLFPLPVGDIPRQLPQFGSRNIATGEPFIPGVGNLKDPFPWTSAISVFADDEEPDTDQYWEYEEWEKQPGVIMLSHQGCGYFWFLVVNGAASGTVWDDSSAATAMLEPTGFTFLAWYPHWLNHALWMVGCPFLCLRETP